MKKTIIILFLIIFGGVFIFAFFSSQSFNNLKFNKIEIYNLEIKDENIFYILNDYEKALNNKSIVKTIEKEDIIKKIKKIVSTSRKEHFDVQLLDMNSNNPERNTPNFLLIFYTKDNKKIYLFLWLYDDINALISYFNGDDFANMKEKDIIDIIVSEENTKELYKLIK